MLLKGRNLKVYISRKESKLSCFTLVVHACTQSLSKQGIQKKVFQNFQFFQPLNITFMCTCDFYRHEDAYTYRRKEFQNILDGKLCNCFGQLLSTYLLQSKFDKLEQVAFLSLTVGVSHFLILGKNFPQSHLIIIRKCPQSKNKNNLKYFIKIFQ